MFSFNSKCCSLNSIGNTDSYMGPGITGVLEGLAGTSSASASCLDDRNLDAITVNPATPHIIESNTKLGTDIVVTVSTITSDDLLSWCILKGSVLSGSVTGKK